MARTLFVAFGALLAFGAPPLNAAAQALSEPAAEGWRGDDAAGYREAVWRDAAHRRDRLDAVPGYPEFAPDEAALRAALDAGLAQGWLDRDDFLIFGRQLHQTELLEARDLRLYGDNLSDTDRDLIRGELDELRGQLDETRARSDGLHAQR